MDFEARKKSAFFGARAVMRCCSMTGKKNRGFTSGRVGIDVPVFSISWSQDRGFSCSVEIEVWVRNGGFLGV